MKLKCKTCGAELTVHVVPLGDGNALNETDGQPYLPMGFYHVAEPGSTFDAEGSIVVNLGDLTGAGWAKDGRRYNGCCGVDGLDGLNLVCPAGHDVGTEKSDCWMPHRAVFVPALVIVSE